MRYYIIAGEASGDLHGSYLVKRLHQKDREAHIRCWGGDLMASAGAEVVKHYRDLAFMGFAEVVKNLPTILRNLRFCKEDIKAFNPHVVILIDYPGFNLRMAEWAKKNGYPTVYYISPQVWAWKQSRVHLIRRVVDRMLVILPFERTFYKKWKMDVSYVGHPLAEIAAEELQRPLEPLRLINRTAPDRPVVALLPGSRQQEVSMKLPIMLEASVKFPQYQFVIAQAPSLPLSFYQQLTASYPDVLIALAGQTYSLLRQSEAALVTSGTATLETALFGVPQVVCYKGSWLSYQIARRVVKVPYISLVNLIMNKEVVKELIQEALTVKNVVRELKAILGDTPVKKQMLQDYQQLKNLLHQQESASEKAAEEIMELLRVRISARGE